MGITKKQSEQKETIMKPLSADDLRALIRLIGPVRALREDTEKSLVLETYPGTGAMAVRTFRSLRDQIAQIAQDEHVAGLDVDADETSKDKALVSQVMIASGQLLAYLEAETGLTGIASGGKGNYQVQTAPNIELNMGDLIGGQVDRVMDIVNDALRNMGRVPRPPRPPEPPQPPHPGQPPFGRGKHKRGRDFAFWEHDDEDDEA